MNDPGESALTDEELEAAIKLYENTKVNGDAWLYPEIFPRLIYALRVARRERDANANWPEMYRMYEERVGEEKTARRELEAQLCEAQRQLGLEHEGWQYAERQWVKAAADCDEAQAQVAALRDALAALLSLHDDPCPYDAATTRHHAREALTNTTTTARQYEERIRGEENDECANLMYLACIARHDQNGQEPCDLVRILRTRRRAGEKGE